MIQFQLRAAFLADCDAIASVWHAAWHDAHVAIVPAALLPHRGIAHFRNLARTSTASITVAVHERQIVGFAGVDEDEVELLFVNAAVRGTGVADALIACAELQIGQHHALAHLFVVDGNARARRFRSARPARPADARTPRWAACRTRARGAPVRRRRGP